MLDAFDLISDLHTDNWRDFNFANKATSRICVIAGDVAIDRYKLYNTLSHICNQYQMVFYIDGNEEHRECYDDLIASYREIDEVVKKIPNCVFLHNNITTIEGVAFVATNGWYSCDAAPEICSVEDTMTAIENNYGFDRDVTTEIQARAWNDAAYVEKQIAKLQKMPDIKHIAVITHFVPMKRFLINDPDQNTSHRINASVNNYMPAVFAADTERKVKTWCFGHYHVPVDETFAYTRFVCNPRGRTGSRWLVDPYHPLRISIT